MYRPREGPKIKTDGGESRGLWTQGSHENLTTVNNNKNKHGNRIKDIIFSLFRRREKKNHRRVKAGRPWSRHKNQLVGTRTSHGSGDGGGDGDRGGRENELDFNPVSL